MRAELEKRLNIKARDIYGLTEVTGPSVSMQCLEGVGMHVQEDHFYPEIKARIFCGDSFVPIDPDTVVEGLERQFPREWLEQVSIRRKESIRVEKKRSFMDRLAEVKW